MAAKSIVVKIDIQKIKEHMEKHPEDNPPCEKVGCPLHKTFKEHPEWMYVPWKASDVNPYCKDSNCPWYDEAMR